MRIFAAMFKPKPIVISSLVLLAAGIIACFFLVPRKSSRVESYDEILRFVPSDACAVVCSSNAQDAQELLFEPLSPYSSLDLRHFHNKKILVSYHYFGNISPMVVIPVGKQSGKNADRTLGLISQAREMGLNTEVIDNTLLISESASLLSAAERHVALNASILDLESLKEVMTENKLAGESLVLLRNDAISYFLEQDFLSKYFTKKQMRSFLSNFCEWTALTLQEVEFLGGGEKISFEVYPLISDEFSQFAAFENSLPCGDCSYAGKLPRGTSFFMWQMLDSPQYYFSQRRILLDSRGLLNNYNIALVKHKEALKESPELWAQRIGIKEVAKIVYKGEELLLFRRDKQEEFTYAPKTAAVLFGSGFAIKDETCVVTQGEWALVGSEAGVRSFQRATPSRRVRHFKDKNVRAVLWAEDLCFSWTKSGLSFEVYKPY